MSECNLYTEYSLASLMLVMAIYNIMEAQKNASPYGRYTPPSFSGILIPAKIAWFVQELPSFLVPVLLLYRSGSLETLGCKLLLFMFCGHYFHRYVSIILHRLELFSPSTPDKVSARTPYSESQYRLNGLKSFLLCCKFL
uniref:Steroid 5-alpha reductase C-terminal domain-containing protein n=1 Tax=Callorhinchus milii TaxID=7868 RepID=A0A4W3K4C8_CALMI